MTLKKKVLGGLAWSFAQRFAAQGINFVVSVLLARLLLPEDFGLVSLVLIFLAVCSIVVDGGLTSSLIRMDKPEERDYSTVFFINLIGSCIVYLMLFASAPFLAAFFGRIELAPIYRVLGLSIIIKSFIGVQRARLTKIMDFKTQMVIEIPSLLLGGSLGVGLAMLGFGVWSLVWMNLCQSVLSSLQLWTRVNWRPLWIFDWTRFRFHFDFGYKLTLSAILNTIYQNVYAIIIGKYFSVAQLGFYTRAESLNMLPVNNISVALNRVTYPMFASIQNDVVRLKMIYKRLMTQVLFWLTPLLLGAGILAEPIFILLFTAKWLPAVPYFQILCVTGIMYPLHDYNLNILKVMGRSDLFLRLEVIKKVYTTIGLFICVPFGIYGLLYFQVVSTFIGFFINSYYSGALIHYPVKEQLRDIWSIWTVALTMGCVVFVVDTYFVLPWDTFLFLRIAISSVIGAGVYLALSYFFKLSALTDFRLLILKR